MEEKNDNKYSNNKLRNNTIPFNINSGLNQIPQNTNLEEVVLGALIIDSKAIDEVIDILSPEVFYSENNKEVFLAIKSLFNKVVPIDIYTVLEELKNRGKFRGVDTEIFLLNLRNKVSSSANIEYHCRILQQKAIKRELINISSKVIQESHDDTKDVFDILDNAESNMFEITNKFLKRSSDSIETLINEKLKELENMKDLKDGVSGLNSGFLEIDKITSGWQNSNLIIIAARPGMGKTAFIVSMARNMVVDFNIPIAIFSLEMSSLEIVTRFISTETGIPSEKFKKGNLSDDEWSLLLDKITRIEKAPLYIDDTPSLSIFDLRAKARRLVSRNGVKMIMIDYLQLMKSGEEKGIGLREQEISTISRNLKSLAKELNIPIIALAQLSRQVETQGGAKRPMLSHLRESGAIEQDADLVSFLYRPEYYKIMEWDDDERSSTKNQAEFIIAKHRNGGLDSVKLKFTPELTKFSSINNSNFINAENLISNETIKIFNSKRGGNKALTNKNDIFSNSPKIDPNEYENDIF